MVVLLYSQWHCSIRASLTFSRKSETFLDTSTSVSGPLISKCLQHFAHDLSTLFALPLLYDGFPHTSLMVWELPSPLPGRLRTPLTLPSWSKDFTCTSLTVWGLPSHFPHNLQAVWGILWHSHHIPRASSHTTCRLRAFYSSPSDLIASLVCFTHDLSTLFALPLSYDCFPHTSLMVWELPSQLPDSLRTSSHFPYCLSAFLHFSHGLRTSHILPSRSEGFPHSLMVSVLPNVSEYEQDISLIKGRSAWIYSCMDLFYVFFNSSCYFDKGVMFIFHTLNREHLGHHDRHLCASLPAICCKMSIISFIT